jgi:hypothetical protein
MIYIKTEFHSPKIIENLCAFVRTGNKNRTFIKKLVIFNKNLIGF